MADTPLALPPFGLGLAGIGNLYQAISDDDAAATLAAGQAAGFDYVDTAPYYGHGLSERRLGDFLKAGEWQPKISTKVGRVLTPHEGPMPDFGFADPASFLPSFDYSGKGIEQSFADSQQRLGVEAVDVLLLHDIGRLTHGDDHDRLLELALAEALPAMDGLKALGKTKAIGLGVNEIEVCREVLDHQPLDVILLAGRYTLLEHEDSLTFLDDCHAAGVGIIIGGAFNSGLLTGDPASAHYDYADAPQWALDRVKALGGVCGSHGVSLAAAALQFCAGHPAVLSVIPGVQTAGHVTDLAGWLAEDVPTALWNDMKEKGLIHRDSPIGG